MARDHHLRGARARLHQAAPRRARARCAAPTPASAHPAVIEHLTELGVTAVELLPVHEFADDGFLEDRALRNYWGYSTLALLRARAALQPAARTPGAQVAEFKAMVKALHAAGIEVILDVVYNHTCEGNHLGPDALRCAGIDNATYYWLMPEARYYLDFTGTRQQRQRVEPGGGAPDRRLAALLGRARCTSTGSASISATTLGRVGQGEFSPHGAHLPDHRAGSRAVAGEADRRAVGRRPRRLPGGQLPGAVLASGTASYRDAAAPLLEGRREPGVARSATGWRARPTCSRASAGSPQASINFITAHDGFTLHDLVSYGSKHNEANGERNQDGADDNQSWNHGVEGETDDPAIIALRERQQRNLLATLLLVAGRADAAGGRRDRPHPARQQQRLLPGQRALLVRLEPRRSAARAAGVHAAADRAAPRGTRSCSSAGSSWATSSGSRSRRTWPGCGPTAAEMTPQRLAEAVDLGAGVRAGRRRDPDDRRARRSGWSTTGCWC